MSPDPAAAGSRTVHRKLRVAYAYRHFSSDGSIPSLYKRLAERLAEDADVTLYCAVSGREPTAAPLRFRDVEPVTEGRGRFRYALECGSFAVRATRAVSAERTTFDLAHAEGFALLRADLVTVHAVRKAEIARYFDRVEPTAKARRFLSPYVLNPQALFVVAIERRLFAYPAPFCIAASQQIKDDLERNHGVPPEQIEVIPYAVEVDRFRFDEAARRERRTELGVSDAETVVLFVGDSFERKGLRTVLEAVGRTGSRPLLWVIGGDDAASYAGLAESLGIRDRVRFLGRRPSSELPGWHSASDVLVLPSRNDAWGLAPIEAMSCGRVPVVSAYTGCSEVLADGVNGFVLDGAGSASQLAALLDGPLADGDRRAAIGASAKEDAQRFAWPRIYPRLLDAHRRAFDLRQSRLEAA